MPSLVNSGSAATEKGEREQRGGFTQLQSWIYEHNNIICDCPKSLGFVVVCYMTLDISNRAVLVMLGL